jgi:hypothetical protein
VIGERDGGQSELRRPGNHAGGGALSIGGRRMKVEIDERGLNQRPYPVSGAVHAGWDIDR